MALTGRLSPWSILNWNFGRLLFLYLSFCRVFFLLSLTPEFIMFELCIKK